GREDSFFRLGGHSLRAITLVSLIRQHMQKNVPVAQVFATPDLKSLACELDKTALSIEENVVIPAALREKYPLSSAQKRMYALWELDRASTQYNMPATILIKGNLDVDRFLTAYEAVMARHSIYRSTIHADPSGTLYQTLNSASPTLRMSRQPGSRAINDIVAELVQPFDLVTGPLLRASLIRLNDENEASRYLFFADKHHIVSDGITENLFIDELFRFYSGEKLKEPAIQYSDYAVWEQEGDGTAVREESKNWWLAQFSDPVSELILPVDFSRNLSSHEQAGEVFSKADLELTSDLEKLAAAEGVSLYMLLLTAFYSLLYKYTGQEDIVVGSISSGRLNHSLNKVAGVFINTLPLRARPSSDKPFSTLLDEVKKITLNAYSHQAFQFQELIENLNIRPEKGRNPLFDILFVMQNHEHAGITVPGLTFEWPEATDENHAKFDIDINCVNQKDGLLFRWGYASGLFGEDTVRGMAGHYLNLLKSIVKNPDTPIKQLDYLPAEEVTRLLEDFNNTQADFQPIPFVSLFDEIVRKYPSEQAVIWKEERMSYRQLNEMADQIAKALKENGLKAGQVAGLIFDRTPRFIAAMLGIFKAGGIYLPVDPEYPEDRIGFMLKDSNARMVICRQDDQSLYGIPTVCLEEIDHTTHYTERIDHIPLLNDLAYIIYTSGSTGQPKGVMVSHGNLSNFLQAIGLLFDWKGKHMPLIASPGFDISLFQLLGPLCHGGTVVVSEKEQLLDPDHLATIISQTDIIDTVPGLYSQIARHIGDSSFKDTDTFCIGGDRVPDKLLRTLGYTFPNAKAWATYGPTEGTIFCTTAFRPGSDLRSGEVKGSHIGRPIANVKLYVLGPDLELLPVGVAGQLCIGGAGVAQGYLNRPELTAERFCKNPFGAGNIYQTGDTARWLPNGEIEFLGRQDKQVKIRGFRVEPGEIERYLQKCPGVKESAVIARKDQDDTMYHLVAYIVLQKNINTSNIKARLLDMLPAYMVPSIYIELPSLPLTNNNKVDIKALEARELPRYIQAGLTPPQTDLQIRVAGLWKQVIGGSTPHLETDFFESGGHSLKAIRLLSLIRKEIGVNITVPQLFTTPTLGEITSLVETAGDSKSLPAIHTGKRPARIPLSFSQERLWFIHKLQGSQAYHQPTVLKFKKAPEYSWINNAFRYILERHEVLRTTYNETSEGVEQKIHPPTSWKIQVTDGTDKSPEKIQEIIREKIKKPFDLERDYMLRAELVYMKEGAFLVIVSHHIANDGWSMPIFLQELMWAYESFSGKKDQPELAPLPIQYADHAIWQRNHLKDNVLAEKITFWESHLSGAEVLQLPTDKARPSTSTMRGSSCFHSLPEGLTKRLESFSAQNSTTLFMTLFSAFKILLHKYSGQQDITVGIPVANRGQVEVANLIGFFVNTLAIRSHISANKSFLSVLSHEKQILTEAYEHQDVPFEKVVEKVGGERDMSRSPLFQVMFVLQNNEGGQPLSLNGEEGTAEAQAFDHTLYDLTFDVRPTPAGLVIQAEYSTDLYKEATIRNMVGHYQKLLENVMTKPDTPIGDIRLTDEEERKLIRSFNNSSIDAPGYSNICTLITETALRFENKVAIQFENESITYGQLCRESDRVAAILIQNELAAGEPVAIMARSNIFLIPAILGILKAGGAYLPLDPAYPTDRKQYILKDSGARIVLGEAEDLIEGGNITPISISDIKKITEVNALSTDQLQAGQTAYIIYTSGTTGKPKGVAVPHRAMSNHSRAISQAYDLRQSDAVLQFASPGFDVFIEEVFPTLIAGATLIMANREKIKDIDYVLEIISTKNISLVNLPTAFWTLLASTPLQHTSLRKTIIGTEKARVEDVKNWLNTNPDIPLINAYGPTEAAVTATFCTIQKEMLYQPRVPIGKPLTGVNIYILDSNNHVVPIGIAGELCIGGMGVASEYLNSPDLSARKFVNDPFKEGKMYRTGDLARWLPDGNIDFLGRLDEQVKIRGYRIEPEEIEEELLAIRNVIQAAVVAKEVSGNTKLIAYVVPGPEFNKETVVQELHHVLPDYMVPSAIVTLDKLPLNVNSKTDKKSLSKREVSLGDETIFQEPQTQTEKDIAECWASLLELDNVGLQDNFFSLGGDSILSIQVVSRLKRMGYRLKPKHIFEYQTVGRLASALANTLSGSIKAEQGLLTGTAELHPIQRHFFNNQPKEVSHYNQSVLFSVLKSYSTQKIEIALHELAKKHDALRFRYKKAENTWEQQYTTDFPGLDIEELDNTAGEAVEKGISRICDAYQSRLNINDGPIYRAVLIKLPQVEPDNRLFITIHHLAVDALSWRIIQDDLEVLLQADADTEKESTKTASYRQWTSAIREYARREDTLNQTSYWLDGSDGFQQLRGDLDRSPSYSTVIGDMSQLHFSLEESLTTSLLQKIHGVYGTEVNDILLTALASTFYRKLTIHRLWVGMEGHGREEVISEMDVTGTVGWFTNLYPVALHIPGNTNNLKDWIISTKEQLRAVPDKGLSFGALQYYHPDHEVRNILRKAEWNIEFNYLGQIQATGNQIDTVLNRSSEDMGRQMHPTTPTDSPLTLTAMVVDGKLHIWWGFDHHKFTEQAVMDIGDHYMSEIENLTDHCLHTTKNASTPADYGLQGQMDYKEYERFKNKVKEEEDFDELLKF
ncbi:MAG: amino acid adenylation domain-containing protein, partial [Cyclobacteriaceae bacterium]